MEAIKVVDTSHSLKGHYKAHVYEGDIRRAKLTKVQREENLHEAWKAKLEGRGIEFYHRGEVFNREVDRFGGDNLIVTVGKGLLLDRLYGLSAVGAMTRLGVGTSNTAAAVGNTTLTGGVFVAFDAGTSRSSLTVTSQATFGTGTANITWAEMGEDNSTTLLSRIAPIGPFTKTSAVSIIVIYQLTQA